MKVIGSPLHVYGIWHKPDKRWVFGPCVITIAKSKIISEDKEGHQIWSYYLQFVSLLTGFVEHNSKGIDNRYYDSRHGICCKDIDSPLKDWGNREIPWKNCEWIDLGHIVDDTYHKFHWNKYRFYEGVDAFEEKGTPSWW